MPVIDVDDETYERVRFAAGVLRVTEAEVIAMAIRAFGERPAATAEPAPDPWTPVAIYGRYEGQRVEAQYVAATRRVVVTSGSLAGTTFTSPSAAARAVIADLNPARASSPANGWVFWRVVATDDRLDSLR